MNTVESIKWFLIIMGLYAVSCTFIAYGMKILNDICIDLYKLWEGRKNK